MNSFAFLLTPLAVLLPIAAVDLPGSRAVEDDVAHQSSRPDASPAPMSIAPLQPLQILEDARRPVEGQVRIEQRVIIRIAPSTPQNFERSLAELNRRASSYEEVRLDGCIPINLIAAVYPRENRLLLIMRDRRVLSAALERSCSPQWRATRPTSSSTAGST